MKIMTNVQKHGGPCLSPADVEAVVNKVNRKSDKISILKDEIRYLTVVLGVKLKDNSKRLVLGKKDYDTLKSDLISVLSTLDMTKVSNPENVVITNTLMSNSSNSSGICVTSENRKRKRINDEDINCDNTGCSQNEVQTQIRKKSKLEIEMETFDFTAQGTWVGVAYENDYFIGQVVNVKSESCAVVQFMRKGYNGSFKWPLVIDIDEIESKFVFVADFEVQVQGRKTSIPKLQKIEELYTIYKEKYFDSE